MPHLKSCCWAAIHPGQQNAWPELQAAHSFSSSQSSLKHVRSPFHSVTSDIPSTHRYAWQGKGPGLLYPETKVEVSNCKWPNSIDEQNFGSCQLVSKHDCHSKAVMSWSCLRLRVVSSQATEDLATQRMERWHGCQSPDMSCLHLSRYFPSYHHIPAPMRQGRWDTRSQEAGTPIFSRTPWSSLPSLGGKVTQNFPRFLPIQNVVAFISI